MDNSNFGNNLVMIFVLISLFMAVNDSQYNCNGVANADDGGCIPFVVAVQMIVIN